MPILPKWAQPSDVSDKSAPSVGLIRPDVETREGDKSSPDKSLPEPLSGAKRKSPERETTDQKNLETTPENDKPETKEIEKTKDDDEDAKQDSTRHVTRVDMQIRIT